MSKKAREVILQVGRNPCNELSSWVLSVISLCVLSEVLSEASYYEYGVRCGFLGCARMSDIGKEGIFPCQPIRGNRRD